MYNYAGMHQEAFDEATTVIEAKGSGGKFFTMSTVVMLQMEILSYTIMLYFVCLIRICGLFMSLITIQIRAWCWQHGI